MAASPHSWDFLLLRLRELRLPLLRGSASRTSGPTANRSPIFFLVAAGSLKCLAAHQLLFVAMFRLFCGSSPIARDAEINNDPRRALYVGFRLSFFAVVLPDNVLLGMATPVIHRTTTGCRKDPRNSKYLTASGTVSISPTFKN
jgi:hypothetical protein